MASDSIKSFDEEFIRSCQRRGMSLGQTQFALNSSPTRKSLIDALVKAESTKTQVVMIVDKDDPILKKIKPTEGEK